MAVLSTAIGARATAPAPGARRERPATPGSEPHLLRLSADPCAAQATRGGVQSQNGVASTAATGWLSTSRRRIIRSGRRHEGRVQVYEPNRRWASDITSIRAWDGQKGRLAIMIDCADRMVLAWRFATRMTADDLAEMLREAIWHRFGERGPTHEGSNSSATMGRSTPRIGFGRSCEPWDSSRVTRPGGVRSQTAWRRRSLGASSGTMSIRRVSKRWTP